MNFIARETLTVGLALGAALAILANCTGCKPAQQPDKFPPYCYNDHDFTERVTDCALTAPSREASRACRAAVLKACGITETVSVRSVAP